MRTVAWLAVDRMTTGALWRATRDITYLLAWDQTTSIKRHEELLQELRDVLDEIELRGDQLKLIPDQPA